MSERDQLKKIIGAPREEIAYFSHPGEGVLRDYIAGRLKRRGGFDVAHAGSLTTWHRAEVTAHLLTCPECAQLVTELRREPAPSWLTSVLQRLFPAPVPPLARVVMLAQSVIILGLIGVLYFKPAPFFSGLSPTASVIPAPEVTKAHQPAPPTPHPQELTPPPQVSDSISQLVESHPLTVHVTFREDMPMRELTNLMRSVNGILILVRQSDFVIRFPAHDPLDSIMEKLSQSPYIIEARKD
jgi:hypothetical protein